VIVHEAPKTGGLGADIAPVQRVTGFDTVMPYYKLELDYLPDAARIAEAVQQCAAY
jgi:2-oxoisovalerate dehydrogenase E1 component beta subunit